MCINTRLVRSEAAFQYAANHAARALERKELDTAIHWVSVCGEFAWKSPPGFFRSEQIDEILFALSLSVPALDEHLVKGRPKSDGNLHIVHVLTRVYPTGGHTRLAARLIDIALDCAPRFSHSAVLIDQGGDEVPDWFEASITRGGGEVTCLPSRASQLEKARLLREMAAAKADLVVLYVHPSDPVPCLSFASTNRRFRVAFLNHADHVFSLGPRFADFVLEFRKSGREMSLRGRGVAHDRDLLVPIPIEDPFADGGAMPLARRRNTRIDARARLGLPAAGRIGLTVGAAYKYSRMLGLDFCRAVGRILDACPDAMILAVGLPSEGRWLELERDTAGRFRALGKVNNPQHLSDIYSAADVYLEGFPFSSLTAMLEAALYSLPVQRFCNEDAPILSGDDVALDGVVSCATNEVEYVEGAIRLFTEDSETLIHNGTLLRECVKKEHCGKDWFDRWMTPALERILSLGDEPLTDSEARNAVGSNGPATGIVPRVTHEHIYLMNYESQGPSAMLRLLLKYEGHLPRFIRLRVLAYALRRGEGVDSRAGVKLIAMNLASIVLGDNAARALNHGLRKSGLNLRK